MSTKRETVTLRVCETPFSNLIRQCIERDAFNKQTKTNNNNINNDSDVGIKLLNLINLRK